MIKINQLEELRDAWLNLPEAEYKQLFDSIIHRKPHVQEAYEKHKAELNTQGITTSDYIRDHVLHVTENESFIRVMPNIYPYNVGEGILHYLVWCSVDLARNAQLASCDIAENSDMNIILFQAPEGSRTVPGITHYHLFLYERNDRN